MQSEVAGHLIMHESLFPVELIFLFNLFLMYKTGLYNDLYKKTAEARKGQKKTSIKEMFHTTFL